MISRRMLGDVAGERETAGRGEMERTTTRGTGSGAAGVDEQVAFVLVLRTPAPAIDHVLMVLSDVHDALDMALEMDELGYDVDIRPFPTPGRSARRPGMLAVG